MDYLFREIMKFFSLPFREISRSEISLETLFAPLMLHLLESHLFSNLFTEKKLFLRKNHQSSECALSIHTTCRPSQSIRPFLS